MFIHDLQAHVRYEIVSSVQKEVGARSVAAPGNRKRGSKLSSAKREELYLREARKIWGYTHFRCSKTTIGTKTDK